MPILRVQRVHRCSTWRRRLNTRKSKDILGILLPCARVALERNLSSSLLVIDSVRSVLGQIFGKRVPLCFSKTLCVFQIVMIKGLVFIARPDLLCTISISQDFRVQPHGSKMPIVTALLSFAPNAIYLPCFRPIFPAQIPCLFLRFQSP